MSNLGYAVVNFFYLLGLAVWVGGMLFVAVNAAPLVFRLAPSRAQAGAIAGAMLRRFDGMILASLSAVWIASALKVRYWEGSGSGWMMARYSLLLVMTALALCSIFAVSPRVRKLREEVGSMEELPQDDPRRRRFESLHKTSVRLMGANLVLGLIVLFLS
ncbi:MAG: DUF4149 domain-containing protein [Acidobacteria bacterium]|nr:DUF4149 domain-containing protein [Acidobacteriota bacterium]